MLGRASVNAPSARPGAVLGGSEAEEDDHQAAHDAYAAAAQQGGHRSAAMPVASRTGQVPRPNASISSALSSADPGWWPRAGCCRPARRAASPDRSEQQGLVAGWRPAAGAGRRVQVAPETATERLDAGQAAPPAGQVESHGDQQQPGDHPQRAGQQGARHRPAGQAEQQAGAGVAERCGRGCRPAAGADDSRAVRREWPGSSAPIRPPHAQAVASRAGRGSARKPAAAPVQPRGRSSGFDGFSASSTPAWCFGSSSSKENAVGRAVEIVVLAAVHRPEEHVDGDGDDDDRDGDQDVERGHTDLGEGFRSAAGR